MPPPPCPPSTLPHLLQNVKCQILGVCHGPVYSPSQMEIPRGGICKDVLHVVADPDIQIRRGGGGKEGGQSSRPWDKWEARSQKSFFRFSQFGLKIFGPSPRSATDIAAVWIKVACIAIGIVSMCKVLVEELRSGDWVELWNFLTSTRIVTKMMAPSPKL